MHCKRETKIKMWRALTFALAILFAGLVTASETGQDSTSNTEIGKEPGFTYRQIFFNVYSFVVSVVQTVVDVFGGGSSSPTTTTTTTVSSTPVTATTTTPTTTTTTTPTTATATTPITTMTTTPTTTTATTPITTTTTTPTTTTTTTSTTTTATTPITTTTTTPTTTTTTTPITTTTTTPTTTTTTTPTTTTTTTPTTTTTTTPTTTTATTPTPTTTLTTTTSTAATNTPTSSCSCGITTRSSLRVVGGSPTMSTTEFPWQVVVLPDTNGSVLCGGALIDASWVLTAITCMYNATTATVRAGVVNSTENSSSTYQFRTGNITKHPQYLIPGVGYKLNDLALIKTSTPFNITSSVSPICMAIQEQNYTFFNKSVNMAGWGVNSASNTILNSATFTVLNTYDTRCPNSSAPLRTYCLNTTATQGPCISGDGGSPITWFDTTVNRAKLLGFIGEAVTSCNNISFPVVRATRISPYLNWIKSATGINFCIP